MCKHLQLVVKNITKHKLKQKNKIKQNPRRTYIHILLKWIKLKFLIIIVICKH